MHNQILFANLFMVTVNITSEKSSKKAGDSAGALGLFEGTKVNSTTLNFCHSQQLNAIRKAET